MNADRSHFSNDDVAGKKTHQLYQTWNGSAWVNNNQSDYTYDADGNETQEINQTWKGSGWVNNYRRSKTWQRQINDVAVGGSEISSGYRLSDNYPNPFNPKTDFGFRIVDFGLVTVRVYDVMGKVVSTIVNEFKYPGEYQVSWDASNMPSGVYYYRLQTQKFTETKKMILLR